MSNWLKLTDEDIQNANSLPATEALVIHATDLSATPTHQVQSPSLKITLDDLAPAAPQPIATPDLDALETLMFNLVNAARVANLSRWLHNKQLKWHPRLSAVARGHSADMLKRGYIQHNTPEGITAAQRLQNYHINYLACGENIGAAYGVRDFEHGIQDIMQAFLKQPPRRNNHRGNLLNPMWTHVGIGVAYHSSGTLLVTQNFISTFGK